jgi:hypothetical protein
MACFQNVFIDVDDDDSSGFGVDACQGKVSTAVVRMHRRTGMACPI